METDVINAIDSTCQSRRAGGRILTIYLIVSQYNVDLFDDSNICAANALCTTSYIQLHFYWDVNILPGTRLIYALHIRLIRLF